MQAKIASLKNKLKKVLRVKLVMYILFICELEKAVVQSDIDCVRDCDIKQPSQLESMIFATMHR